MNPIAFVLRLTQVVRQQQGNVCAGCGVPHDTTIQRLRADKRVWRFYLGDDPLWTQAQLGYLVLAYRDGDRRNVADANLIALCSVCSLKHTDSLQTVRVAQQEMWD